MNTTTAGSAFSGALERTEASLKMLLLVQVRAVLPEADGRGQLLTMRISGDPRPADVDAARVSDAIAALLAAAIGFNRPQGRVRVDLDFKASEAHLSVFDEGAAEGREPYLAPVRRVFEAHGGAVECGREADGHLFRGRLPLPA